MFSLLTFNIFHTPFSGVSIADFELVNASWDSRYSCVKFENAPLFMTFIGNFKALICLLRSCFLIQPTEQINICLKLSRQVFTSSKSRMETPMRYVMCGTMCQIGLVKQCLKYVQS